MMIIFLLLFHLPVAFLAHLGLTSSAQSQPPSARSDRSRWRDFLVRRVNSRRKLYGYVR